LNLLGLSAFPAAPEKPGSRPPATEDIAIHAAITPMTTNASRPRSAAAASIENRFLAINRDRLRRVEDNLTPRQRDFFEILPLLFHINHPLLPGYISKTTAFGICDYVPSSSTIRTAKRVCRSFEYDRRSAARLSIHGLYMMGSPGTIAYSRTSDLDMWLCHAPELEPGAIEELTEKSRKIEKFAENIGLEVHFFVFDPESLRRGETLSLSDESSGSSQHYLLLDEFYRSSLLVAGLKPLWWRVPSSRDADYDEFVRDAFARRFIDRREYIDFGGVASIPAEEFFGAAVWHLYKSIQSPYKSVMKLLLMEAYAAEYPEITLLSQHYKQNIESEDVDPNAVDPYILMYKKIEAYLLAEDDPVRLDVLRRSFYLKTNLHLSERAGGVNDDWRREVLAAMTETWGWARHKIVRLDQSDRWRIDTAIEERRDLINTLKDSYAVLSQFARSHSTDRKITEHDLHVLGRKLYAAFEKKPAKIEVLTRGFCSNPREPSLSLHQVPLANGELAWILFTGLVKPDEVNRQRPMKRAGSAAEILAWCHMNRLIGNDTLWHLFAQDSELNPIEIKRINDALESGFANHHADARPADLSARPRLTKAMLLANVGVNPFSGSRIAGAVLTSDRTDAFQFGGTRTNLVRSIDLVFTTSWSETFCFHYEGANALLEALGECLQWLPIQGDRESLPRIDAHCFTSGHAAPIEERLSATFNDALGFLAINAARSTPHFVIEIENQLHRISMPNGKPKVDVHHGHAMLADALGESSGDRFNKLRFDSSCRLAGVLPDIYAQNREGRVQIFAQRRGARADVYVLDEFGLLLAQTQECFSIEALLQHYARFLESALPRCYDSPGDEGSIAHIAIDMMEIVPNNHGILLKPYYDDLDTTSAYLSLQVLADADSNGHQQFTIYCNNREFSTWEYGGSLFVQVAEYVRSCRQDGVPYPIYITDLDLSTRFRKHIGVQSLRPFDLLNYKKRIEFQLTRALSRKVAIDDPVAIAS
jgi:adenylate cyclase, class 1